VEASASEGISSFVLLLPLMVFGCFWGVFVVLLVYNVSNCARKPFLARSLLDSRALELYTWIA